MPLIGNQTCDATKFVNCRIPCGVSRRASMSFVVDKSGRIRVHRDIVLKTPRLILTSWLVDDVDSLHEVHSDRETMRFVRHGRPESRLEVEQLVDDYIAEDTTRGWTKWRLADRDDELVGRAGFGGSSESRGLSYVIRRSDWGRGLATEVAEALVLWHLAHAVDIPLRAIVALGNDTSVRVLEKVGFDEVGGEDFDGTPCRAFVHPSTT
jgi:[ribosomal protein S5]-alanine N-acetyltransferase